MPKVGKSPPADWEVLPLPPATAVSAVGYMLENPEYPLGTHPCHTAHVALRDMGSENPTVDDDRFVVPANQQERLENIGWVIGFVDGEGCFSAPVVKSPKMTIGWQVQPAFAVVQGASSRDVLDGLMDFFGCGGVYVNRRRDNHKEDLFRYCVNRRSDLRDVIIPFFTENPLRTSKVDNFRKFAAIIAMMETGKHLTVEGLTEIASVSETMNHRKPSEFLRILRDHTPTIS